MSSYCSACWMNTQPSFKGVSCYFFYYWVGELFFKGRSRGDLGEFIGIVYNTLHGVPNGNECNIKYEDNNKHLFEHKKKVYIFSHGYETIQRLVQNCASTEAKEYLIYLQGIRAACSSAGAGCEGGYHSEGTYCNDFNKKYKVFCDKIQSELIPQLTSKLKPNPNPNQAGSSGSFSVADVNCNLDDLPSKLRYKEFNKGAQCPAESIIFNQKDTVKTYLKSALGNCKEMLNDVDNITGAWCYICNGIDNNELKGNLFYLFYYWLGDKVWKEVKDGNNSFKEIMGDIYNKLRSVLGSITCGLTDENIEEGTFYNARAIYNYSVDYSTITECIQKSRTSGSTCTQGYSEYLEGAAKAYNQMEQYCEESTNTKKACCTQFKKMFKEDGADKIQEPSKLKFELESLTRSRGAEAGTISPPAITSNTAPIVSSVFAVMGLPALAYFLYKYNLLPSWVGNYFAKNNSSRRKRRSNMRDFDTFTENSSTFDSASEYTTTVSTADSTDGSTIYNRRVPPSTTRREANNTGGHQNIGYQNM
ncbi:KIR protein [Plasmodium coatneyi]|uniref:KIR protein n=1 Tax=Plasmodium coatneyi TaxID=208452 RepID=A0A1B1DWD5_9APIC|nr:KIR protein [Plasmodium coatneyi]ANQ07078.1 KIR protein [Plasmodium coatneyi]